MKIKLKTEHPANIGTPCLILGVFEEARLPAATLEVDQAADGYLKKVLEKGDLDGKVGSTLMLYQTPGLNCERVLLVRLGEEAKYDLAVFRKAMGKAVEVLEKGGADKAACALTLVPTKEDGIYARIRDAAIAASLAVYRPDQCKSQPKPPKQPLQKLTLLLADTEPEGAAKRALAHGKAIAQGMRLARELGDLPGNLCTPVYLTEQARSLANHYEKLRVSALDRKEMEHQGMGALLSVARGSRQPPRLIVMEYCGGRADEPAVALVGKGLTFDAGGISLKPADKMDEMKYDMMGGASVIGAVAACCELGLPINLIGLVPASENLPDGNANKPGDIVTSMSGQTIEILNTDAEGRLILCDTLTYAERFQPESVVDVATLTGACVVALGKHASGLFSGDDALAEELLAAGADTGDRAWRMPLWEDYQEQLDSNFADLANIGGRDAGAITAACFLSRFAKKYRWAHLDIAGVAWKDGKEKGATGRPVPLLTQWLINRCNLGG